MRKLKTKHNPVKKHKNSWVKSVTILGIVAFGISSIILLSNLNNNSSQENVKGAKTSLVASSVTGFPQQYGEFVQNWGNYNGNKSSGSLANTQFGKVRIDGMAPYVIPAGTLGTSSVADTLASPARIWIQVPGAQHTVTWHWLNFFCPDPANLKDCTIPNNINDPAPANNPADATNTTTITSAGVPNVLGTIGMHKNGNDYCGFYQSDFFITDIDGDTNLVYGDLPVNTVTPVPTGYSIFTTDWKTLLATSYNTHIKCLATTGTPAVTGTVTPTSGTGTPAVGTGTPAVAATPTPFFCPGTETCTDSNVTCVGTVDTSIPSGCSAQTAGGGISIGTGVCCINSTTPGAPTTVPVLSSPVVGGNFFSNILKFLLGK